MIHFYAEEIEFPEIDKKHIIVWIKQVAALHDKRVGEISYLFCSDTKILEVNREFLQHDYYTDIITFDYSEGDRISGDIYISLDTVQSNADSFENNYFMELHRVIIHGILHLCGQNDKSEDEQNEMTQKENEALELL